jgi:hypothetical protein
MSLRFAVTGASGTTGRLVIAEVLSAGHTAIAIGRDRERLAAAVGATPAELRATPVVSAETLADTDGVINCAGPFLDLDLSVAAAAVEAAVAYTDVSGEAHHVERVAQALGARAERAGVALLPGNGLSAMIGGLAAARVIGERSTQVLVAYAMPGYRPTRGSLASALSVLALQTSPCWRDGQVQHIDTGRRLRPLGDGAVVAFPLPDAVLIGRAIPEATVEVGIRTPAYLGLATGWALRAGTVLARRLAGRVPAGSERRAPSPSRFCVHVGARTAAGERSCVSLAGRDIYRTTAKGAVATIEAAASKEFAGIRAAFEVVDVPTTIERLGLTAAEPLFDAMTRSLR